MYNTKEDKLIKRENKNWIKTIKKNRVKTRTNRIKKLICPDHLKKSTYIDFLNSKYWGVVRNLVLARDGHKCIICGSADNLHIHHNTYKHHFYEHRHLEDLMTLCAHCHEIHHQSQD